MDKIAPIKEIRIKERPQPLMNSEILELILMLETTICYFYGKPDINYYDSFRKSRNLVQRKVKLGKIKNIGD